MVLYERESVPPVEILSGDVVLGIQMLGGWQY